jgi:F-type H+-transporting ATPase subunit gamma
MPSLKDIRKRIASVKSTQKITRAMKMVAGARLTRAQKRITEMRPYAVKTQSVLAEVVAEGRRALADEQKDDFATSAGGTAEERNLALELIGQQLLEMRPERRVLLVVLTSDRGLCGGFNNSICKRAEQEWRKRETDGQHVHKLVIGRKGRDYFRRRSAPMEYVPGVWDKLDLDTARSVGGNLLQHFLRKKEPVDAIYLIYNEFKSAMTQQVTAEHLLPIEESHEHDDEEENLEFIFEPDMAGLMHQLLPMYIEVSILRALYESMASELGARMTAMDSATNNATEMIADLTLQYNRARQAAITTELMEIVGGSEALKG